MMNKIFAQGFNISWPGPTVDDGGAATLNTALGILFGLLGSICVIVIIYAGIRLMLARGNPEAIGKLRSTLLYAAIGLIVAMTATGILNFVAGRLG